MESVANACTDDGRTRGTCRRVLIPAALLCAIVAPGDIVEAQAAVPGGRDVVSSRAVGTFQVKLTPQPARDGEGSALGRMHLDKEFFGDLEGTAAGEMLTALTATEGSAGYVAIERVWGRLHGRSGSFVLQHSGTMTRGAPDLAVTIVPDSGTGELEGIAGRMEIIIEGGMHRYALEYTLPAAR